MEVWSVRITDKRDTDYNDTPIREVLMPNGEWRGCIGYKVVRVEIKRKK